MKKQGSPTSAILDCDIHDTAQITNCLEYAGIPFRRWETDDQYEDEVFYWIDEVMTQDRFNRLAHQFPILAACTLQELICGRQADPKNAQESPQTVPSLRQKSLTNPMNSASTSSFLDCGANYDDDPLAAIKKIMKREKIACRLWVTNDDYDREAVFWVSSVLTQDKLNHMVKRHPLLSDCSVQELLCGQRALELQPLPLPSAASLFEAEKSLRRAGCFVN